MRIVAGKLKGRPLQAPKGRATRPTSDRVRESLFAILSNPALTGNSSIGIPPGLVVDLFAGTGALGFEALSRGADGCLFVEQSKQARECIAANAAHFGVAARCKIIAGDARRISTWHSLLPTTFPQWGPVRLIFLDPPYDEGSAQATLDDLARYLTANQQSKSQLPDNLLVVAEVGRREALQIPAAFSTEIDRIYGSTRIVVLRCADATPSPGIEKK